MLLSLDLVRARAGDCLLLHYGTARQPRLMLIDGGPANVYRPHLRPRLEQIRDARHLEPAAPLPVDALVVSHVDGDHIKGLLDLTHELRTQKTERQPQFVRVARLWHNTFDDILKTTPAVLKAEAQWGEAALAGAMALDGDEALDVAKVLASIPQGRMLRDDASLLGHRTSDWKVNAGFTGGLILARKGARPIALGGGLRVTVIGPMLPELQALQQSHDAWLRQRKTRTRAAAESALAAFVDTSVANLSSIVLLAEAGRKRVLLTGDARGDRILEGLALVGLLKGAAGTLHVDILKVPHHGSANNVEERFFRRVTADHYVFCGDGEYGNPERETLEMLFAARGEAPFTVHFTYPLSVIDAERKRGWQRQRARASAKAKAARPAWSPKRHGLAAFFEQRRLARGQQVVEMPRGVAPHVIDLLDPARV